ncbi:NB-ARC domain-containing protein [Laspinema palackyanum]|uniref:NB-ARC domain-containing protein n=1 Tax=Laspinema palackyanum TaxID=3231601 RepID=UPI00345D8678|nr:NB-ARC domain-containing protein [Laspinema sp. D2c]
MTNPRDFLKTHKLLIGGTAILSLAALGCGHVPGILAAKYAVDAVAVSNFLGNVLSGMTANNFGALIDRLRSNPDILKNQDLGRATGEAIALGIRAVADEKEFTKSQQKILRALADKTVDYWLKTDSSKLPDEKLSPLDESQIRYAFSANAGDYDNLRVLDEPQWEIVVRGLMQQHLGADVDLEKYEPAIEALAHHLNQRFATNLREVLADDAVGKQAFKKMLLDLQRETVGILRHICDRIDELPNKTELTALFGELETALRQDNQQQIRLSKQILAHLQQSSPSYPSYPSPPSPLYNVPNLPPKFLPRPEELAQIKQKLLGNESQKLVMTGVSQRVGVQGMGGIGKTLLAAAVAQEEEVQRQFPDGVMWVTLGQTPDIVTRQTDIAGYLLGNRPYFEDIPQGKAELRKLLADKACLLILDDVWQMPHAAAFDVLGTHCQLLLTTRDAALITGFGAQGHEVGLLTEAQALGLLAQWAGEHWETLPPEAAEVARECGYLPLAVAICGAMVAGEPANRWQNVLHKLQTADLEKLHQDFPDYPYPNLFKALQVSVDALPPAMAQRYLDFGIFPEDTPIPEAVLVGFWAREGLTEYDVQDVVDTLVKRSLAFRDSQGRITLHDLQLDYVRKQVGDISRVQERFLNSYRQRYPQGYHTVEDDGYFFHHLITHHLQHRPEEIRHLLLHFPWLQAKLDATDVKALLMDFESVHRGEAGTRDPLRLLESAIRNSAHILGEDKTQLAGQLLGRLLSFVSPSPVPVSESRFFWEKMPLLRPYLPKHSQTPAEKRSQLLFSPFFKGNQAESELSREGTGESAATTAPEIEQLLTQAKNYQGKPWFRPLSPSLNPAGGALLRTLIGHHSLVYAVTITPDGKQAVSASEDKTLKLWDLATGSELATLTGHSNSVYAVAITPDGKQALSASSDNTLKLWDLARGEELATLSGHSNSVYAVAITPDGKQAVSASSDNTLKLWDLATGEELATLWHTTSPVNAVAISPDGKQAVSASSDNTLKLWDLATGEELATLTGHDDWVNAVAISPDGKQAVSASLDNTLKLWDLVTGSELATLWHTSPVNAVAISPDGKQAVSASLDNTLKLWDLVTGEELATLAGHSYSVNAVAIAPDGKHAVSASWDNTLKLWDLDRGEELATLTGHSADVIAVAITPDGKQAVSASSTSSDKMKLWDLATGSELTTLTGHSSPVKAVAITPDGKQAVSASWGKTLKLWDWGTGEELATLTGHSSWVNAVAITPDGKQALSASEDNTLKLWDLATGSELATLTGHSSPVKAVAITPDGKQAVSASGDKTLKLWDLATGSELATLIGHSADVIAVAITPDGKQAVSASEDTTLKLWDLGRGEELATLTGHRSFVQAVAITPDGKQAVSASMDNTLKLWNLATGDVVASFGGDGVLFCCAIAPNGVTVVAGEASGRVHFLRLEGV